MDSNSESLDRGDAEHLRLDNRARELIELFDAHDRAGLPQLSPEQRKQQLQARAALYQYTGWLYTELKRRGLDPSTTPSWRSSACTATSPAPSATPPWRSAWSLNRDENRRG